MSELEMASAALVALAEHGVPTDVQELLVYGNPERGIAPGAFSKAVRAVLSVAQAEREPIAWLDVRTAGLGWQNRIIATNPQFVENNGPENFVALYASPVPSTPSEPAQQPLNREAVANAIINNMPRLNGLNAAVDAIMALALPSTNRECPFCSRRVFEPCQSIAQAQNACTLSSTPRETPHD